MFEALAERIAPTDEVAEEITKPLRRSDIRGILKAAGATIVQGPTLGRFLEKFAREKIRTEIDELLAEGKPIPYSHKWDSNRPIRAAITTLRSSRPPKMK